MQALTRAADRGVKVRIYLDGTQLGERHPSKVFNELAETPSVEIRTKHTRRANAPQELRNRRAIAAQWANFSASGLKLQDKDLIVIESAKRWRNSSVRSMRDLGGEVPGGAKQ